LLLRVPPGKKPPAIDVRDGRTLRHLRWLPTTKNWLYNESSFVNPLFVSPDGRTAYMAYALVNRDRSDGTAFVDRWNIRSGKSLGTTPLRSNGMFGGRISGGRLFILTDTKLVAGEANNWRRVRSTRVHLPGVSSTNRSTSHDVAAISPRGDVILFATRTGAVTFVNVRSGRVLVGSGKSGSAVQAADFSPRGDVAVTTDENGHVTVWNPQTAHVVMTFTGHEDRAPGISFSADGKTFFTSSLDGAIFEWDLSGKRRFGRPFRVPVDPGVARNPDLPQLPPLALSADGARFATRTGPTTIGVYSVDTLRRLRSFSVDLGGPVTALAWSPKAETLAVIGGQGHVQLWSIAGRPRMFRSLHGLGRVNKEPEVMNAVTFSPDGALVSAIALNKVPPGPGLGIGLVGVWRVSSGKLLWKRMHRAGPAYSLAFSRDGKRLAVGFEVGLGLEVQRGVDQLVDPETGGVKRVVHPIAYSQSLAFASDGTLATGAFSGIVERWDVSSGKRLDHPVLALAAPVSAISFTPSGDEFATAGGPGGLKLWDTKTLQEVGASFPGSPGLWANAAFTPDGSKLVALYQDGRGTVWPSSLAAWDAQACRVAGRNFTREEWSRFGTGRSYGKTCS
jgi:WD40 repeat protein